MGARFYDDAIAERLQKWIKDPNIHILKPSETTRMLEIKADESRDRITLPQIQLSRSGYTILNSRKKPMSFDGITVRAYDKDGNLVNPGSAMKLNAIPIRLEYQLDIYTRGFDECDEYVRDFVFHLVNHPVYDITIPYNGMNLKHNFTMHLEDEVEDTSDIPQRLFPDQFTRYTMSIVIDDAYLFSIPSKGNVQIELAQLDVKDKELDRIVERDQWEFEEE